MPWSRYAPSRARQDLPDERWRSPGVGHPFDATSITVDLPLGASLEDSVHRSTQRIRLAQALPDATFLGLDRLGDGCHAARLALERDVALRARVDHATAWLRDEGAAACEALTVLLVSLEGERAGALVIDLIEQDLVRSTQEALIRYLRRYIKMRRQPLFVMTRSSAILDLAAVGSDEAIVLCPASHSPPVRVAPYAGAPGFEAVATCLASPEVRARIAAPPQTV